jgi:hypothetical protein
VFEWDPQWWSRMPPVPEDAQRAIADLGEMGAERRTSLGWTAAIAARDSEIVQIARELPFFSRLAIGLVSPTVDAGLERNSFPFGVILYATGSVPHPLDQEWRQAITFQYRETDEFGYREYEAYIPVVIRRGTFTPASTGQIPGGGSYACWATWHKGKSEGWLTARHVARAHPPSCVVDEATDCVDAALVDVPPLTKPPSPAPVSISTTAPATGVSVELDFKPGSPISTSIIDVSSTLGINDARFPLRISTNAAGKSGNSGSLITEGGMPYAMYTGNFIPVKAPTTSSGVGLVLSQLNTLVDLEVFT